jgi:hypothetical protein
MKEIFRPGMDAGLSFKEIDSWINGDSFNPRAWTLKTGAPKVIVDLFPDYVDWSLRTGQDWSRKPGEEKQPYSESETDYTNASTLFVFVWQLARQARSLVDAGIASNIDRNYVDRIVAHAKDLEHLNNQIHDSLLTEQDKANGAVSRQDR